MRLHTVLLLLAIVPVSAADIALDGRWTVTKLSNPDPKVKGSMKPRPGAMIIEIHGTTMVTTMAFDPEQPPEKTTGTITVSEKTADRLAVVITRPDGKETGVVTREESGPGLVLTTSDAISHIAPFDDAALAKAQAQAKDESAPAA